MHSFNDWRSLQRDVAKPAGMSGTVNISRSLFGSTNFKTEPFTEREAWIWLLMEASWKPRKKRVGDYVVSLERGQLAGSVRFMSEAWGWHRNKTHRFLGRIEDLGLIRAETGTGVNVISVCKYDDYQNTPKAAGTGPGQDRDRTGTNENKGEIKKKEVSRKTRIREDIEISDSQLSIGLGEGHPETEVRAQFEAFRDSAIQHGRAYVCWDRAFRSWFRSPYFKKISSTSSNHAVDIEAAREKRAEAIRNNVPWQCTQISAAEAREMIGRGIVTEDQCRKAGVI